CEIQLLQDIQELQGGWLPVVEEEHAEGNDCSNSRVLALHNPGSLPSSELGVPCPALSQGYPSSQEPPQEMPAAQEQAVSGTFSGLLEVLGQQGADVGSLVGADLQALQGFQGPGGRSAGAPLLLCQAPLQLGRRGIPAARAHSVLSQRAHREHGEEHADAQPAGHRWGEKGRAMLHDHI
ncbi:hypothetical protein EK904_005266, partial [Melospiza melodia maxima]